MLRSRLPFRKSPRFSLTYAFNINTGTFTQGFQWNVGFKLPFSIQSGVKKFKTCSHVEPPPQTSNDDISPEMLPADVDVTSEEE